MSGTKKYYEVFEKELHTEKAITGWANFIHINNSAFSDDKTRLVGKQSENLLQTCLFQSSKSINTSKCLNNPNSRHTNSRLLDKT